MSRLPALDGLRAISILLVLATHMLPVGPKAWRLNETTGPMGMSLFFVLSGFLVTSNLLAYRDIYIFFVRRATRIIPLAFLYLTICFLFVTYQPLKLIGSFVFIENYVHLLLDDLNGHFWSLCVEVHFYIFIGLVFAVFGIRGLWLVVPTCIAVTATRVLDHSFINIKTHLRVDEILVGAIVAMLYYHGALRRLRTRLWMIVIAAILWGICSSPLAGSMQYFRPYTSMALLALVLYCPPGWLIDTLSSRPAKYIAEMSYALYVIHPLTIYSGMNEGSIAEKYLIKRPISFVATFLLAHVSTFHWEKRWTEWGKAQTRYCLTPTTS